MREVRFGSYSMCATLAGTPSLSARRKSISRYARLCPPPWCRAVTRPWTLRPPRPCSGRTSDFSGWSRVTSAKSATDEPRRPGVVGLYLRMAMVPQSPLVRSVVRASGARAPEELDAVAGGHGDDGALGVLALAHHSALRALPLPLTVDRVDGEDLHVEDLLHSDLDLGLVGVGPDDERVLVLVQEAVALLRDDRGQQDVPGVADAHACSSVWSVTVSGSACAASAGVVTSAAATVRGARMLGVGSTVASPRSRSVVPSPSMEGMAPGMSGVVRSGSSAELARPVPFAGPSMYSVSAVSVKTTSSATSTS